MWLYYGRTIEQYLTLQNEVVKGDFYNKAVDGDWFNRFPEKTKQGTILAIQHLLSITKRISSIMKIVLTVWGIAIVLCILEAYFCTKFEDKL